MLQQVPLFSALNQKDLQRIAAAGRVLEFEAGHNLTQEGELGVAFFLILEGRATVLAGKRKRALGPGDFLGEIALLDGGPRTATVVSETPITCFTLVSWAFKPILMQSPQLAHKLLVELCARLRAVEKDRG